jgi:hypothetical protein
MIKREITVTLEAPTDEEMHDKVKALMNVGTRLELRNKEFDEAALKDLQRKMTAERRGPLAECTNYHEVQVAFHRLWTKAVGSPNYDKAEWKRLDSAIDLLATDGPGERRK